MPYGHGGLNMRASPHVALMPPMPPRGRQVDVGGPVAAVLPPSLPPLKQAVSLILRQWRPASARWPASAWQTSSRGRAARAAWSLRCRAACAAGTPPDCRAGARPGCGADTQPKPARPLRAAWRSGCGSSGYRATGGACSAHWCGPCRSQPGAPAPMPPLPACVRREVSRQPALARPGRRCCGARARGSPQGRHSCCSRVQRSLACVPLAGPGRPGPAPLRRRNRCPSPNHAPRAGQGPGGGAEPVPEGRQRGGRRGRAARGRVGRAVPQPAAPGAVQGGGAQHRGRGGRHDQVRPRAPPRCCEG